MTGSTTPACGIDPDPKNGAKTQLNEKPPRIEALFCENKNEGWPPNQKSLNRNQTLSFKSPV